MKLLFLITSQNMLFYIFLIFNLIYFEHWYFLKNYYFLSLHNLIHFLDKNNKFIKITIKRMIIYKDNI